MKALHMVAFALLVIGGFNWLLVGAFGADIGQLLFGSMEHVVSRIIYVLVGLSALYLVATHRKECSWCRKEEHPAAGAM